MDAYYLGSQLAHQASFEGVRPGVDKDVVLEIDWFWSLGWMGCETTYGMDVCNTSY